VCLLVNVLECVFVNVFVNVLECGCLCLRICVLECVRVWALVGVPPAGLCGLFVAVNALVCWARVCAPLVRHFPLITRSLYHVRTCTRGGVSVCLVFVVCAGNANCRAARSSQTHTTAVG
jgi:hypothetical protein